MKDAQIAVVVPRLAAMLDTGSDDLNAAVDEALGRHMSWKLNLGCNTTHWIRELAADSPEARIKAMVRLGFDAERSARASDRIWELFREGGAREKKWALIALQRIDPDGYADAAAEGIRFTDPD
jgi:hypothetical protein